MARSYLRPLLIIHARIITIWGNSRWVHRFRSIGRKLTISCRIRYSIYTSYDGLSAEQTESPRVCKSLLRASNRLFFHRIISPCGIIQWLGTKSLGLSARPERYQGEDRRTDGLLDRGWRRHSWLPPRSAIEDPHGRAITGNQVSA